MMSDGTVMETHAHEVMEMMISSGKVYSRESLLADIRGKFGAEAMFHTCSETGLSPDGLINFLAAKGKLRGTAEAFVFAPAQMCHGH